MFVSNSPPYSQYPLAKSSRYGNMPFYGKIPLRKVFGSNTAISSPSRRTQFNSLVTLLRDFTRPAVLVLIDEAEFQSLYIDGGTIHI